MPAVGTTHHVDRIQSAISSNGAAKSALIASWQRSACFHKLDPLQFTITRGVWAALDVSSCRPELIDNFVNLIATAVSDAAARIEAECFRLAYPDARILVVPVPDKMGKALGESAATKVNRLATTFNRAVSR